MQIVLGAVGNLFFIAPNYIIAEGDLLKPLKTLRKKYDRNIK